MEKIVPGEDPEDFDSDPILEAVELKDAGDPTAADQLLNGLLIADLRYLAVSAVAQRTKAERPRPSRQPGVRPQPQDSNPSL